MLNKYKLCNYFATTAISHSFAKLWSIIKPQRVYKANRYVIDDYNHVQ